MGRASHAASIAARLASLAVVLTLGATAAAAPVVMFVSVPPQASLVRDIGGPHVVVHCLVSAGQDPHVFEPTPKQMRRLGDARIFFTVGMPFEKPLLDKLRGHLPNMTIVDSAEGFARRSQGDHHHHDHKGSSDTDPHVWLSPDALRIMARNTAAALARVDPAHRDEFQRRLKLVDKLIDKADARCRAKLASHRGRAVYVFHPAFGYFCDAYGLRQKAVEVEGRSPSTRYLRQLAGQAREDGARTIFVQKQFDPRGAKIVADAIGARLIVVDPLAEEAVANLGRIAEAIAEGLKEK